MKWVKGLIPRIDGSGAVMESAAGYIAGHFGVYRDPETGWHVPHIPSGLKLNGWHFFKRRKDAIAVAERIASLPAPWSERSREALIVGYENAGPHADDASLPARVRRIVFEALDA